MQVYHVYVRHIAPHAFVGSVHCSEAQIAYAFPHATIRNDGIVIIQSI